jgi:putative transcriptional regulator
MAKRCRSNALAAVHEAAFGLREADVFGEQTMKEFDELCLTPVERLGAVQIRHIRTREKASQAVFARYLNVTSGIISQWQRGNRGTRNIFPLTSASKCSTYVPPFPVPSQGRAAAT